MAVIPTSQIESSPGVCGGRPHISGHRIRVQDIAVWHEQRALSADEIAATIYPHLTLGQIHAALAYYFDHISEIRDQIRADEEFTREFAKQHPSTLRQKLRELEKSDDPISPG